MKYEETEILAPQRRSKAEACFYEGSDICLNPKCSRRTYVLTRSQEEKLTEA